MTEEIFLSNFKVGDQFRIMTKEECIIKFSHNFNMDIEGNIRLVKTGNVCFYNEFGLECTVLVVSTFGSIHYSTNLETDHTGTINELFCIKIDVTKSIEEVLNAI